MQQIELDKYLGKRVLLNVRDAFVEENRALLQLQNPKAKLFYARLVAVDEIGLWIENPGWKSRRDGSDFVSHRVHVLVPWVSLISIAVFPDREFPDDSPVPDSGTETIGFKPAR